jgi:UDP-glucose 4-epimerase
VSVLIVGGTSALSLALTPVLAAGGPVLTAGRRGCDVHLDLGDESLSLPPGLDAVVHTAAQFGGSSDAEILATETINVLGTLKLCQAAARAGVRQVVLISSMSACVTEDSPYFGIYALSKRQSEDVARLQCAAHALPLAILRPSQIYGNQEEFRRHQPFVYAMADRAQRGDDIEIYGSHDARRNYLHADDLSAIVAAVIRDRVEGTYACTHPVDVTYSEMAAAAFAAFGAGGRVRFRADKPDIPDNVFGTDDALYARIGLYPGISMRDGMQRLAQHRRRTAA